MLLHIKSCGGGDDENRIPSSQKFLSSIDSIYPNIRQHSFTILVFRKMLYLQRIILILFMVIQQPPYYSDDGIGKKILPYV